MKKNPVFNPIDRNSYPRSQQFYYYTEMAPTTYSVNVTLDVTILRKTCKDNHIKFFPTYLYLVTRAIGKQQELRMCIHNGVLGYWDNLTPTYPQFHDDDKTTSLLWTEYDDSFQAFYTCYLEDIAKHKASHGVLSSKGTPLSNSYIISCIPWFTFNSFSLHNHGIKDYFVPSFEAGGFVENNGKITMPLSITVHHATTDGYHLNVFFNELQRTMNHPDEWFYQ
ncbi:CatA-like O-acetyltransferase [Anaerorhabdus furcosa]|uniref:Chloramphenicol O-acetyltransferase type A n=1 Tax=Anaerorhabdus furcosa TaxID=118967 RepID=A0A1T4N8F9_9FIRM|nr:CatA-like O-acetyltransferase [Anaerorhabdus furcosa]SJZ75502.1 chloramphenicol O-acetyltransferase type A [Anaerorhabdus furcosa]